MSDMSLVEAVAAAIHGTMSNVPWEVTVQQDVAIMRAKAAISTMFEHLENPSEAMLSDGENAVRSMRRAKYLNMADASYQAMLAQAKKEAGL